MTFNTGANTKKSKITRKLRLFSFPSCHLTHNFSKAGYFRCENIYIAAENKVIVYN